jgi:hypothetical protein
MYLVSRIFPVIRISPETQKGGYNPVTLLVFSYSTDVLGGKYSPIYTCIFVVTYIYI